MSTYVTYFTYTKDAWRGMVQRPEDREAAAARVIESAGGHLSAFYWMLGDHDGLVIFDVPDATAAAGVSAAISASGRVAAIKTVHLLTSEEARASRSAGRRSSPPRTRRRGAPQAWRAGFEEAL